MTETLDLEKLRELAEKATPGEHVALSCPESSERILRAIQEGGGNG